MGRHINSAEEAAEAYDEAARQYHGEFACVNFPRKSERGEPSGSEKVAYKRSYAIRGHGEKERAGRFIACWPVVR
jgi:hypothetical protein